MRDGPIASSPAMPFDCSLVSVEKNTSIKLLALSSEAKCLTLEAKNKVLAEHLESSGEVGYITSPDKLPTLHEAQLVLTSFESLEDIDLRDNPSNPKYVHISTTLFADERAKMIDLLREDKDVFAWNYDEMPGLDPALVAHSLNVNPKVKLVVQPNCAFHAEITIKIKEEVEKLLATRFIKSTKKPT
ncbi:hypothetical protein SLE2022_379940 [Rubroshorea leprosula]